MQIRTPTAAGLFYPKDSDQLRKTIRECTIHEYGPEPKQEQLDVLGVICPHAGYMYSGPIACNSFYAIMPKKPKLFIMIGPNHWGLGYSAATMNNCQWQTPLGFVETDSESAKQLEEISDVHSDFFSHTKEHSLEVQIPMLQEFFQYQFKILPILLIGQQKKTAQNIGHSIAQIARKKNSMIVGSSDLTHYTSNEIAYRKDNLLIKTILDMDVDEFYRILEKENISACGYGAIASTMIACSDLGASKGTLLKYATSGDISGQKTSVVGYCSIVFN